MILRGARPSRWVGFAEEELVRISRAFATLALVLVTAACGKPIGPIANPTPGGMGDATVFVNEQGTRMCAYISTQTQDAFCGTSSVTDRSLWVAPDDDTEYDPSNGLTNHERALGVILNGWPQMTRPKQADTDKVANWQAKNPDFAKRFAGTSP